MPNLLVGILAFTFGVLFSWLHVGHNVSADVTESHSLDWLNFLVQDVFLGLVWAAVTLAQTWIFEGLREMSVSGPPRMRKPNYLQTVTITLVSFSCLAAVLWQDAHPKPMHRSASSASDAVSGLHTTSLPTEADPQLSPAEHWHLPVG